MESGAVAGDPDDSRHSHTVEEKVDGEKIQIIFHYFR